MKIQRCNNALQPSRGRRTRVCSQQSTKTCVLLTTKDIQPGCVVLYDGTTGIFCLSPILKASLDSFP